MSGIKSLFKGDKVIWVVVLLLSIFSVLAVYSSISTLAYKYQGGNTWFYFFKHFFLLAFGLLLMYITHLIDYKHYARFSRLLLIITVPLLFLTLLIGKNLNDANRWLTLPVINLSFQTSDLAKLSLIVYLARLLAKKQDEIKDFKNAFLPIILPVMLVCGLIFPANFSTAALLFSTALIIMFIGRVSMKYILSTIGIGIVGISVLIMIASVYPKLLPRAKTWENRVENFFGDKSNEESDSNYQKEQAKIAVATGGIFGKLPGNSTQRNFLPHPYSDFIFAIIIEEYGIVGGVLIVLLYMILLYRGIRIASMCDRPFAAILVMGLCFSLAFQAMINMAVAVGIFPVTGQPLPLVSMGGTSLWFTSVAIGIVLSVSRTMEKNESEDGFNSISEEVANA